MRRRGRRRSEAQTCQIVSAVRASLAPTAPARPVMSEATKWAQDRASARTAPNAQQGFGPTALGSPTGSALPAPQLLPTRTSTTPAESRPPWLIGRLAWPAPTPSPRPIHIRWSGPCPPRAKRAGRATVVPSSAPPGSTLRMATVRLVARLGAHRGSTETTVRVSLTADAWHAQTRSRATPTTPRPAILTTRTTAGIRAMLDISTLAPPHAAPAQTRFRPTPSTPATALWSGPTEQRHVHGIVISLLDSTPTAWSARPLTSSVRGGNAPFLRSWLVIREQGWSKRELRLSLESAVQPVLRQSD
mmetsp:Transcript_6641/g.10495  ORF Transcript_6641/g.10495 Transcript_6641/m.10495 type:complete len:303 (+) Transcript_6641:1778-2686(+)